MSKSLGNYIALNDSSKDKFGKAMRVLDSLILSYFEAYTNIPLLEVDHIREDMEHGKNPMEAKLMLAEALVARYHGATIARREKDEFIKVFSRGDTPHTMKEISLQEGTWGVIDLLIAARMAPSKSEARRLAEQGAVEVDGMRVSAQDAKIAIKKGSIIRVGKRRFTRVR